MQSRNIFMAFLREARQFRSLPHLYSRSKIIQASIGLVFQCHGAQAFSSVESLAELGSEVGQVSLLLTQRAGYEADSNKYNVVFPGGQADPNQSDFEACKRQLYEEVCLNTDQQCHYVGRLPKNFYYSRKQSKHVYISCHVWVMKQQSTYVPILNKQELCSYRWVPLSEMIDVDNFVTYREKQMGIFRRISNKYSRLSSQIQSNLDSVLLPGLEVGLRRQLWGLSLWVWAYVLQMAKKNLNTNNHKSDIELIQRILNRCKSLQVQFKSQYLLGPPLKLMSYAWHQHYRINQFKYPESHLQYYIGFVGVVIFVIVVYSALYL